MYSLYTDRPTEFACDISVKNASLKGSIARVVIKSDNLTLLFEGTIKDGKCIVPIGRLKGLLDENTTGKMNLEVIVEDTYFSPWQDDFSIEEHTSVKVTVNENKQLKKPVVEVKTQPISQPLVGRPLSKELSPTQKKVMDAWIPLHEISNLCKKFGINRGNLVKKKAVFQQLVTEYFDANSEFKNHRRTILRGLKQFLK